MHVCTNIFRVEYVSGAERKSFEELVERKMQDETNTPERFRYYSLITPRDHQAIVMNNNDVLVAIFIILLINYHHYMKF